MLSNKIVAFSLIIATIPLFLNRKRSPQTGSITFPLCKVEPATDRLSEHTYRNVIEYATISSQLVNGETGSKRKLEDFAGRDYDLVMTFHLLLVKISLYSLHPIPTTQVGHNLN